MKASYAIIVLLVGMLVASVSAGTLTSALTMSAEGTIMTDGSTVSDSICNGSTSVYGTSTFGTAALKYASAATDGGTIRSISTGAGWLTATDYMSGMTWLEPTQNCNGKTCEVTPGYFTMVGAESQVLLTGPGTVKTQSGAGMFNLDAAGTGSLNYRVGVVDMQGTLSDGKPACTSEFTYSERTQVVGKFDLTSRFSYRP